MNTSRLLVVLLVLTCITCGPALAGEIFFLEANNFTTVQTTSTIPETPVAISTDSSGTTTLVTSNGKVYGLTFNGSPAPNMPKTLSGTGTPVAITTDLSITPPIYVAKINGTVHSLSLGLADLLSPPKTFSGTPVDIATTAIGQLAYILMSNGTIYKTTISLGNITIPSPPVFSGTPTAVFANPSSNEVWITTSTSSGGNVYLYNRALTIQMATGAVSGTPVDIAGNATGDTVVATSQGDLIALRRSGSNLNVNSTIAAGGTLVGVCLNYAGHVVAANQGGDVFLTTIANDAFTSSLSSVATTATLAAVTMNLSGQIYAVGTAAMPSITVTPLNLPFTNVVEGTPSTPQNVTIGNPTGTAPLTFIIPTNGISNSMFKLDGQTLPYTDTVPVGQQRSIGVVFEPPTGTSTTVPQTGTLTINHNITGVPAETVDLTGTVIAATRILNLTPSSPLNFSKVGVYYKLTKAITVSNNGNSPLTVSTIGSTNPTYLLNVTTSITLPQTGSKEIEVTFAPTTANQENGQLTITSDATNAPAPYQLSGEGVTPPLVDAFLVLDGSGSMTETTDAGLTKMDRLISAAKLFIDLTRDGQGDKLGIVRFDHPTVTYVSNLVPVTTSSKQTMKNAVELLQPGGWTSIGNGLECAFNDLTNTGLSTAPHRVVLLLSDGKENRALFVDPANGTPTVTLPTSPTIERYTVGLGLAQNMNTGLLSNLAFNSTNPSKGYFHLTSSNWYTLHKYFVSVLSDTFDQYVVQDPVWAVRTGDLITLPVTIVKSDKKATFVVYWTHPDSSVTVTLVAPDDTTITPTNAQSLGVHYGAGALYAFYEVSFLPSSPWAGRNGQWTLTVEGTQIPASLGTEQLSVSVIAPSDLAFRASLDKGVYSTGETITLRAELLEQGLPIPADSVTVTIAKPDAGIGNLLSETKLVRTGRHMTLPLDADSIYNAKYRKVAELQEMAENPLIDYGDTTVTLYDDGVHHDGAAGDGVWGNTYADTTVEGVYTFSFKALATSQSGELATREKTLSTTVAVNKIDVTKTRIVAEQVPVEGRKHLGCRVTVYPRDRFGNYMGPGFITAVSINAPEAVRIGELVDDNAGGYSQLLHIRRNLDPNTLGVEISVYDAEMSFNLGEIVDLDNTTGKKRRFLSLLILLVLVIIGVA